jgi:hypothetical protein
VVQRGDDEASRDQNSVVRVLRDVLFEYGIRRGQGLCDRRMVFLETTQSSADEAACP